MKTYTKINFADGTTCIAEPKDVPDMIDGVEGATCTDVQMTEEEFKALPEFQG